MDIQEDRPLRPGTPQDQQLRPGVDIELFDAIPAPAFEHPEVGAL